jgi:hypothetical protein
MLSTGNFTTYRHAKPELNASDGRCQMLPSCTPDALEDGCLLPQVNSQSGIKRGKDETQPERQRYQCKSCSTLLMT